MSTRASWPVGLDSSGRHTRSRESDVPVISRFLARSRARAADRRRSHPRRHVRAWNRPRRGAVVSAALGDPGGLRRRADRRRGYGRLAAPPSQGLRPLWLIGSHAPIGDADQLALRATVGTGLVGCSSSKHRQDPPPCGNRISLVIAFAIRAPHSGRPLWRRSSRPPASTLPCCLATNGIASPGVRRAIAKATLRSPRIKVPCCSSRRRHRSGRTTFCICKWSILHASLASPALGDERVISGAYDAPAIAAQTWPPLIG